MNQLGLFHHHALIVARMILTIKELVPNRWKKHCTKYIPERDVIRVDRDSISGKTRREDNIELLKSTDPKVFVGTQLLAKGHDFKRFL